jgi:hypothetical protein
MVEEWLRSEAKALELGLAAVVDRKRARLLAIGEGHQELRQPHVGTMLRTIWPFSMASPAFSRSEIACRSRDEKPSSLNEHLGHIRARPPLSFRASWERSLPVVNGKELIPAFIMEELIDDQAHAF